MVVSLPICCAQRSTRQLHVLLELFPNRPAEHGKACSHGGANAACTPRDAWDESLVSWTHRTHITKLFAGLTPSPVLLLSLFALRRSLLHITYTIASGSQLHGLSTANLARLKQIFNILHPNLRFCHRQTPLPREFTVARLRGSLDQAKL
ncbi:uncharacterized protein EI97DRAFT_123419 [Westerdykella ornata]|uniref:Uncharacterized protein n=1 Tax=Westerdykella ornata TaxID=318751 RepID=A0A6A6JZF4_WESOR|nr:uncharacterized protein EI97DRAFT_123419 [Westerdykella ornata]KAF2280439.1 hypothetical protein EI97DRAFT_123419 [Westerdykella ornata]